jgi:hypothetical protein
VSNDDALWVHQHLFHQQAHDSLALLDGGLFSAVAQAPKEALEILCQGNIPLPVERFDLQCIQLGTKGRLFFPQARDALAQLLQRYQLLLVRLH